jgi:hypothetical protein
MTTESTPRLVAIPDLDPEIIAMADTIAGLEATIRKQARHIGALERDEQTKVEADPLWPLGMRVFDYHCRLSGHTAAEWSVDRFKMIRRLKGRRSEDMWLRDLLRAISGGLADAWMVRHGKTHWEDIFGSQERFEKALAKCPVSWTVPKGAENLL